MVKTVIKRDSKKQAFNINKLKEAIEKAAKDAGVSLDKRREYALYISRGVTDSLANKDLIKATELRARVLRRLATKSKKAAAAWRKYEVKKRKM